MFYPYDYNEYIKRGVSMSLRYKSINAHRGINRQLIKAYSHPSFETPKESLVLKRPLKDFDHSEHV